MGKERQRESRASQSSDLPSQGSTSYLNEVKASENNLMLILHFFKIHEVSVCSVSEFTKS